jgi:hypothetical protein
MATAFLIKKDGLRLLIDNVMFTNLTFSLQDHLHCASLPQAVNHSIQKF